MSGVRHRVQFDSLILGLFDPRAPQPDAVLSLHGVEGQRLQAWCEAGFRQDELLRDARRRGLAVRCARAAEPGPPIPSDHHVMVHLLPVSPAHRRAWYLAVGRSDQMFDEREQQHAALMVRGWHAAFDHVPEPLLGRLLLGEDGRLIHADPATDALHLEDPRFLEELSQSLPQVVQQRWPELIDDVTHDVALTLADRPVWVRFARARAAPGLAHWHWHIELRPLDEQDIPPLGIIEDQRVARAMAYLTDRFAEAPTLAEVAEAVHTSPFHFHRLFVRHVGRSPKHYLLRMQLMVAKWLLRATRRSIGQIATAAGFASHGHFTATFHRMVGQSPSQYRESG